MATLNCADGTVVQISAETEKELRKAFGPKPERTYKIGDIFWRDEPDKDTGNHFFRIVKNGSSVGLETLDEPEYSVAVDRLVMLISWSTVVDPQHITLEEVKRMTDFPAGLRLAGPLRITEK